MVVGGVNWRPLTQYCVRETASVALFRLLDHPMVLVVLKC